MLLIVVWKESSAKNKFHTLHYYAMQCLLMHYSPLVCIEPLGVICVKAVVLSTGYEIGTMMLIFTMALAYSVSSPIILPLALVYFIVQL